MIPDPTAEHSNISAVYTGRHGTVRKSSALYNSIVYAAVKCKSEVACTVTSQLLVRKLALYIWTVSH